MNANVCEPDFSAVYVKLVAIQDVQCLETDQKIW